MEEKLLDLKTRLAEVADLQQAAAVLIWDQETYMPPGGAEARAMQMGTLSGLAHQKATDDAVGALLDDLSAALNGTDADSDEGALVRVTQREYQKLARTPRELVVELAQTLPLSMEAWKKARETDDFATFLPYLEKVIELREWQIEVLGPAESGDPYDVLLDDYEPGLTTATIDSVYDALHGPLVELVEGISAHQDRVDRSVLLGDFSEEKQMAFSREVAEALGYDFSRGRIDVSAHPFTINFGRDDVRITTRFDAADPISAIMSTIHEAGHAIYEQNIAASLSRTGLDSGAGMATHESQSRFYENVLGRSRAFWDVWYPRLQATFAPHFDTLPFDTFYGALNESKPSLIRVEADEVTYGLHIMLRYRLERALFSGELAAADLPAAWNSAMEEFLGLTPPTDSDGVLQDIHWSQGYFGYFPTYLLGSIFASQLWIAMQADLPDMHAQIATGDYAAILEWMRTTIHQHGKKFTFEQLVERATGGPLDWQPYMHYLAEKYGAIYGL